MGSELGSCLCKEHEYLSTCAATEMLAAHVLRYSCSLQPPAVMKCCGGSLADSD